MPLWERLIPFQKKRRLPLVTPPQGPENLDLYNEILSRLEQLERRCRGQEAAFEGLIFVKERKGVPANTDEKR
jgi:hypothetical protein